MSCYQRPSCLATASKIPPCPKHCSANSAKRPTGSGSLRPLAWDKVAGLMVPMCKNPHSGQSYLDASTEPDKQLSLNTIHGIDSVDDLRSWSFSPECRRKHFLDQMLKGSTGGSQVISGPQLAEVVEVQNLHEIVTPPLGSSASTARSRPIQQEKAKAGDRSLGLFGGSNSPVISKQGDALSSVGATSAVDSLSSSSGDDSSSLSSSAKGPNLSEENGLKGLFGDGSKGSSAKDSTRSGADGFSGLFGDSSSESSAKNSGAGELTGLLGSGSRGSAAKDSSPSGSDGLSGLFASSASESSAKDPVAGGVTGLFGNGSSGSTAKDSGAGELSAFFRDGSSGSSTKNSGAGVTGLFGDGSRETSARDPTASGAAGLAGLFGDGSSNSSANNSGVGGLTGLIGNSSSGSAAKSPSPSESDGLSGLFASSSSKSSAKDPTAGGLTGVFGDGSSTTSAKDATSKAAGTTSLFGNGPNDSSAKDTTPLSTGKLSDVTASGLSEPSVKDSTAATLSELLGSSSGSSAGGSNRALFGDRSSESSAKASSALAANGLNGLFGEGSSGPSTSTRPGPDGPTGVIADVGPEDSSGSATTRPGLDDISGSVGVSSGFSNDDSSHTAANTVPLADKNTNGLDYAYVLFDPTANADEHSTTAESKSDDRVDTSEVLATPESSSLPGDSNSDGISVSGINSSRLNDSGIEERNASDILGEQFLNVSNTSGEPSPDEERIADKLTEKGDTELNNTEEGVDLKPGDDGTPVKMRGEDGNSGLTDLAGFEKGRNSQNCPDLLQEIERLRKENMALETKLETYIGNSNSPASQLQPHDSSLSNSVNKEGCPPLGCCRATSPEQQELLKQLALLQEEKAAMQEKLEAGRCSQTQRALEEQEKKFYEAARQMERIKQEKDEKEAALRNLEEICAERAGQMETLLSQMAVERKRLEFEVDRVKKELQQETRERRVIQDSFNTAKQNLQKHLAADKCLREENHKLLMELSCLRDLTIAQQQESQAVAQQQAQLLAQQHALTLAQQQARKQSQGCGQMSKQNSENLELYLRAKSYRKALTWQKKYLSLVIQGYKSLLDQTGAGFQHLELLRNEIPLTPTSIGLIDTRSPVTRFRICCKAVLATVRMKFMVKRWDGRSKRRVTAESSTTSTGHEEWSSPVRKPQLNLPKSVGAKGNTLFTESSPERIRRRLVVPGLSLSSLSGVGGSQEVDTVLSDYLRRIQALESEVGGVLSSSSPSRQPRRN